MLYKKRSRLFFPYGLTLDMGCCDFDNLKGQCHNMFSLDPFLLMILTPLGSLFIYAEVFLDKSFDFAEIFACAKISAVNDIAESKKCSVIFQSFLQFKEAVSRNFSPTVFSSS